MSGKALSIPKELVLEMYKKMQRIRKFEETAATFFSEGKIPGFVHLYIGEEAVAVGACANLRDDDFITSTHRGHGHIVAKGGNLKLMMAELFGKETGYCKGKGGSMHIADAELGILGANGIVGAGHNIAVGAGWSAQYRGTNQVSVCFFGDASTNISSFHEAMNLASVWKLPVIFVCENNLYGISVSQERHQAIKDISLRAAGYGIPSLTADGNDVFAVYEHVNKAIERARAGGGPSLLEFKTYRHRGHFEGDTGAYRPADEVSEWLKKDPIPRLERYMLDKKIADEKRISEICSEVEAEIREALDFASGSQVPEIGTSVLNIYSDLVEEARVR
ncbi:pyruvate dehydrogenase E1 component alpha subunit [Fontibacillus solani]|uniref:Pyruvate dehydrogenase E1 component alpha subunit n=2 Tax=Fontibacillus solani TaxID=1572857 RepID=A0A7W3SY19_9BACL|nr:thiamine pyrophosphate-dependent dehydrogenase E1 component subunit alpha [Fontibacillus solani]MBA9088332.1 pyruvate dehydrogenase E1 component alpha subunit [Fontibacillus solani]